jgi:hypothetical protein
MVPDTLLRRRVVNTSSSRGTHLVLDESVAITSLYEVVNLCPACAEELKARKQAKFDARALREAWWGRLALGACFVGMMMFINQPIPLAIALAWILDRLRVLGLAVALMGLVFVGEYLVGLRPYRYLRRLRLPWFAIIGGVMIWGVIHARTLQRLWRWLMRKRSAPEATFARDAEVASSSGTEERS